MSKDEPLRARLAAYTEIVIRCEAFEQFGAIRLRTGSQGRVMGTAALAALVGVFVASNLFASYSGRIRCRWQLF